MLVTRTSSCAGVPVCVEVHRAAAAGEQRVPEDDGRAGEGVRALQPRDPEAAHAGSHLAPLVEVVVGHAHDRAVDRQEVNGGQGCVTSGHGHPCARHVVQGRVAEQVASQAVLPRALPS